MPPCAPADMNTAYSLWEDARGLLRLVSLAPETPGVWPVVDFFLSHGVTVGAAHSNNRYPQKAYPLIHLQSAVQPQTQKPSAA